MKILGLMVLSTLVFASNAVFVSAETRAEVELEVEANRSGEERERDADSDGDGLGDVEEGEVEIRDTDSDDDGLPTVVPIREIDKATPARIEARAGGDDRTTPLLYQGLQVRGELCNESGDCDDGDNDVTPGEARGKLWINVSGDDVRGMSTEEKTQVQERLRAMGEDANTANDFGLRVANAALENDTVTEIVTSDTETEVRYRTRLSLFGFIPVTTNAVARANSDGDVSVRYPWYRFLSRAQDDEKMTSLALELRSSHDALIATE